ncbi:hypothetical protein K402DRAFT_399249, partial [Aulographum hederae CBS 113979]
SSRASPAPGFRLSSLAICKNKLLGAIEVVQEEEEEAAEAAQEEDEEEAQGQEKDFFGDVGMGDKDLMEVGGPFGTNSLKCTPSKDLETTRMAKASKTMQSPSTPGNPTPASKIKISSRKGKAKKTTPRVSAATRTDYTGITYHELLQHPEVVGVKRFEMVSDGDFKACEKIIKVFFADGNAIVSPILSDCYNLPRGPDLVPYKPQLPPQASRAHRSCHGMEYCRLSVRI